MKVNKAYKFRFEPNADQEVVLNNLLGSTRFVWNQMLVVSFGMFARNERINAVNLVNKIPALKISLSSLFGKKLKCSSTSAESA